MKRWLVTCLVFLAGLAPLKAEEAAHAWLAGDIVYGDAHAPAEIIEYGSFTCPHCAAFANDVFPRLKADYIDTGKVRFIFRNFVRDRYDMAAASLSRWPGDADTAKAMIAEIFAAQKDWLPSENPYVALLAIAEPHGISREDFAAILENEDLQKHLVEMRQVGIETYKATTVPTIILNGMPVQAHSFEGLKELLDKLP